MFFNKKGQIVSLDFFMGMFFLFMIILVSIVFVNNSIQRMEDLKEKERFEVAAMHVTDNLLFLRGEPTNWENLNYNVRQYGLASLPNVIDSEKLQAFVNEDYNEIKDVMNIQGYDFLIRLKQNNSIVYSFGYPITNSEIVSLQRVVEYNGEAAIFVFKLYREEEK